VVKDEVPQTLFVQCTSQQLALLGPQARSELSPQNVE
jgi:hypothetical protein